MIHPMPKTIDILAESEHFVVVNKPAGLLMLPHAKEKSRTLVSFVNDQYGHHDFRLHPCHRLDRETSGAVLFAKGKKNQQRLMSLFQKQLIQKEYVAFVHGQMDSLKGEIRSSIKDAHQRRYAQHVRAKKAITVYKVIKEYPDFSVITVTPITGRTNQIRIHFSQQGHPLVGESVYAFRKDFELKFKRCALHATTLRWEDTETKKQVVVHAPFPKDMENFLKKQSKIKHY